MSIHEEGINGSSLSKEYITRACNLCGDLGITTLWFKWYGGSRYSTSSL